MMKQMYLILLLVLCAQESWAGRKPRAYQAVDDNYALFELSVATELISDESAVFVYESPHGHMYDGGRFRHEEHLSIDLRRIAIDVGFLKNVPFRFGMTYRTWWKEPPADAFQLNAVDTSIITPKFYGLTLEYFVQAKSHSGRQGAEEQLRLYIEPEFSFIRDPSLSLFSLMCSYQRTNGLGWLAWTRGKVNGWEQSDWGTLFGQGAVWTARKGMYLELTCDLSTVGLGTYLSYRVEHVWHDDPSPQEALMFGSSYTRHMGVYGNVYRLGDIELFVEGQVSRLQDIWVVGAKAMLSLATSFQ